MTDNRQERGKVRRAAWAAVALAARRHATKDLGHGDARLEALYKMTLRDIIDYAHARSKGEGGSPPGGVGGRKAVRP